MSFFLDKLHAAQGARREELERPKTSFLERLHAAEDEIREKNIDPWLPTLKTVHGQLDKNGVERISTQLIMDILDVPQNERGKNYRRLAKLMASLGWTAQRMIAPDRKACLEQVRGYCREPFHRA